MDEIKELKVQAYDLMAQLDYLQRLLSELHRQIAEKSTQQAKGDSHGAE